MTEESEAEESAETAPGEPSEATEGDRTGEDHSGEGTEAEATESPGDDDEGTDLTEADDGDEVLQEDPELDPEVDPDDAEEAEEAEEEATAVPPPTIDAPLSSAGRRLGGLVLDTLLFVVTAGIGWFVWSLRVWARGQTPAKSLLSMRVVKLETGRAAKWSTMALREGFGAGLLTVITAGITALVSCFLILGESRQGVWDRIAGTVVVDDKDNRLLR